jgi:hypothetical protein
VNWRAAPRAIAALTLLSACSERAHPAIQDAPGCYALAYGAWSRPVDGTPPVRIALDTVKPEGPLISWSVDPRRVRPNIPQTRTPTPAIWFIDTLNVLHVRWTTGYSGYGLALTRQSNGELAGSMTAYTDAHLVPDPPPPTGAVRAHHIGCATAGL